MTGLTNEALGGVGFVVLVGATGVVTGMWRNLKKADMTFGKGEGRNTRVTIDRDIPDPDEDPSQDISPPNGD
jgi:hypothetical protein